MASILTIIREFYRKQFKSFILRTKNFTSMFYCIFRIYMKFWTLWKKNLKLIVYVFSKLFPSINRITWECSRPCFITPFGSQRVNESRRLQKSAREHFSAIFSSFWYRQSKKTSLLVRSEILGLFVSPLTADSVLTIIWGIYRNQFKCIYLNNQKPLLDGLLYFENLNKILSIFKKTWAS